MVKKKWIQLYLYPHDSATHLLQQLVADKRKSVKLDIKYYLETVPRLLHRLGRGEKNEKENKHN